MLEANFHFFLDFEDPQNRSNAGKIAPDASTGGNPFLSSQPSGTSQKRAFFSLSNYSQYFDVDTAEVVRRCYAALWPRANFLDVLEGNPDLYGPFWIATTVVFILFLTGTISWKLAHEGKGHFGYNFSLLSGMLKASVTDIMNSLTTGAAGLIYGYTGVVPIGLWLTLKWFGSESANLLECWALYGYSNLIWIPVALISWSPISSEYQFFPLVLRC